MLFACNIENTNIILGVFEGDTIVFDSKIATSSEKSADEYAILISSIFSMYQVALSSVKGVIIASVVRPLNATVCNALEKLMHVKPLLVGPGLKTGLNIKTDIPTQVGADIVSNAVAAISISKSPMVLLDFGTATTLTGINENGELSGVLIYPGILSSLDALSAVAAELPGISLDRPKNLLGKNTVDSMVSGIIYGTASMIDGLIDRISEEWKTKELAVIATGGLAEKIIEYSRYRNIIKYEPNLTLIGLKKIFYLNERLQK